MKNTAACRFEKGEVGGRTQILSSDDKVIELGASIVHEENKYFRDAADELGIPRVVPPSEIPGIYNGKEFVFRFSYWTLVNIVKMVFRYGWNYVTFMGAPSEMLNKYKTIYALQSNGVSFTTPEEMLKAMGLYQLTQRTFRAEVQVRLCQEKLCQFVVVLYNYMCFESAF
jgi:prenylcysteine oxidase/farnesylcysteine lyase